MNEGKYTKPIATAKRDGRGKWIAGARWRSFDPNKSGRSFHLTGRFETMDAALDAARVWIDGRAKVIAKEEIAP